MFQIVILILAILFVFALGVPATFFYLATREMNASTRSACVTTVHGRSGYVTEPDFDTMNVRFRNAAGDGFKEGTENVPTKDLARVACPADWLIEDGAPKT